MQHKEGVTIEVGRTSTGQFFANTSGVPNFSIYNDDNVTSAFTKTQVRPYRARRTEWKLDPNQVEKSEFRHHMSFPLE